MMRAAEALGGGAPNTGSAASPRDLAADVIVDLARLRIGVHPIHLWTNLYRPARTTPSPAEMQQPQTAFPRLPLAV